MKRERERERGECGGIEKEGDRGDGGRCRRRLWVFDIW